MYGEDEAGNIVGVLNDFDVATTIAPGPTGNECTGMLPFMAHELLSEKGQKGAIKHVYAHDAESFVWVLIWICLRYADGELRNSPPLDGWLKVDAQGCREKRSEFMTCYGNLTPGEGHEQNWLIAKGNLDALTKQMFFSSQIPPDETCDQTFQRLLRAH